LQKAAHVNNLLTICRDAAGFARQKVCLWKVGNWVAAKIHGRRVGGAGADKTPDLLTNTSLMARPHLHRVGVMKFVG
jgi:hypothetical protein